MVSAATNSEATNGPRTPVRVTTQPAMEFETSRTQRLIDGQPASYHDPVIMVGASEVYEARCRHCHEVPGRPGA